MKENCKITPQTVLDLIITFRDADALYGELEQTGDIPQLPPLLIKLPTHFNAFISSLALQADFDKLQAVVDSFQIAKEVMIKLNKEINDRCELNQSAEIGHAVQRLFALCDQLSAIHTAVFPIQILPYSDNFVGGHLFSDN